MNVSVNSYVTRADISGESLESLLNSCKIYISGESGLLHKWVGLQNVPQDGIYLRYGDYVAEAWAGDSVSASFTSKFYKGITPFSVNSENPVTQVTIPCKIANVVTSIDKESVNQDLLPEINIEMANSRASLTYTMNNLMDKGYFMMPDNESKITYKINGKDKFGNAIEEKTDEIDVLPSHEYRLIFKMDGQSSSDGAVIFDIQIEEYSLLQEEEIILYSKPAFNWSSGLQAGRQLVKPDDGFSAETLSVGAYYGFNSLSLSTTNQEIQQTFGSSYEIIGKSDAELQALSDKGISISSVSMADGIYKYFISFSADWLNNLPESNTEYVITVSATDKSPDKKSNSTLIRIANTPQAVVVEDPVEFDVNFATKNLLNIKTSSITVPVEFASEIEYDDLELQYRKSSDSNWMSQKITPVTRAKNTDEIVVKGLEPDTEYVLRFVAGRQDDGTYKFESRNVEVKTEGVYIIPNASMENWYQDGKVWMPNAKGDFEYWDTGNHGSTTLGENLTESSSDIKHNGSLSACLTSKFVGVGALGKHGAGNIFIGHYAGTSGTNGKIDFGREYNGSHPTAVRVWVNYRPQKPSKSSQAGKIGKDEYDQGQIYIALSTGTKRVDTSDESTFVLETNPPEMFVAYGQYTFEGNYGDDNQLKEVIIPFKYFERAKTTPATHLIIVCTASKFGDYFNGGEGSRMYVDDFELIYE